MEGELDTQELKYSMDLDSSSENNDNSSEISKFQEKFLDTQELSYSVNLSDLSDKVFFGAANFFLSLSDRFFIAS